MTFPFPGMNPYLEGYLWSDVHSSLANEIKRQLAPQLGNRYVARLAIQVEDDTVPADEIGIFYPDVEVIRPEHQQTTPSFPTVTAVAQTITPPSTVVPATLSLQMRLLSVQIRDVDRNELVTSIELLSPTNKRRPGVTKYRKKRAELMRAGVHLLEIDLLRRGKRRWLPNAEMLPNSFYVILLTRTENPFTEVWSINLPDRLPVLPVPLRKPDPDVPLDLQQAMETVCAYSNYDLTIDYTESPPRPPFDEETLGWIDTRLRAAGLRS